MEPNGCYFPMTDQAGDLPIAIAWETKKCIKKKTYCKNLETILEKREVLLHNLFVST